MIDTGQGISDGGGPGDRGPGGAQGLLARASAMVQTCADEPARLRDGEQGDDAAQRQCDGAAA